VSGVSLALGVAIGFFGAIPPGPTGVAVLAHASEGRARSALAVGLGAATVDATLCTVIALGAGPVLARATEAPMVRVFLALAYAVLGGMILLEALLRKRRRTVPSTMAAPRTRAFASGLVRGLTNPTLVINWTAVIAALSAAGVLARGPLAGALFAVGVGLGVSAWFGTLAYLAARARGDRLTPWLRAVTFATGSMLVVVGCLNAAKALILVRG
jgi:threonine/homoserine/homoserine lactone efflux protein